MGRTSRNQYIVNDLDFEQAVVVPIDPGVDDAIGTGDRHIGTTQGSDQQGPESDAIFVVRNIDIVIARGVDRRLTIDVGINLRSQNWTARNERVSGAVVRQRGDSSNRIGRGRDDEDARNSGNFNRILDLFFHFSLFFVPRCVGKRARLLFREKIAALTSFGL